MNQPSILSAFSDGELLSKVSTSHDNAAFKELFARHSAMIFATALRITGNTHDAEEAVQGSFLVLLKKATSLRHASSVGGWLYQVATRIARKARSRSFAYETRLNEYATETMSAGRTASSPEMLQILDEELGRMPEKVRAPLVLVYLEQQSGQQAAMALNLSQDAFRYRLEKGKKLLYERLARRGVIVGSTALLSLLATQTQQAMAAIVSTSDKILSGHLSASPGWLGFLHMRRIYQAGSFAAGVVAALSLDILLQPAPGERIETPIQSIQKEDASASSSTPDVRASPAEEAPSQSSSIANPSSPESFSWALYDVVVDRATSQTRNLLTGEATNQASLSANLSLMLRGPDGIRFHPGHLEPPALTKKGKSPISNPKSPIVEVETFVDTEGHPIKCLVAGMNGPDYPTRPAGFPIPKGSLGTARILFSGKTLPNRIRLLKGKFWFPICTREGRLELKPLSSYLGTPVRLASEAQLTFTSLTPNQAAYEMKGPNSDWVRVEWFDREGKELKVAGHSSSLSNGTMKYTVELARNVDLRDGASAIVWFPAEVKVIEIPFEFKDFNIPVAPGVEAIPVTPPEAPRAGAGGGSSTSMGVAPASSSNPKPRPEH